MATQAICPACEEYISVRNTNKLDAKIRCPHCYADLIVMQPNPLVLDWDEEEDEDWDDDDDDGDDDWRD